MRSRSSTNSKQSAGAVGAGSSGSVHQDRFLGSLLTELDGVVQRPGICVLAATNRPELLDSALFSRFGHVIEVPRPDRQGLKQIAEIHLGETLSFSPNGSQAPQTRRDLVELLITRFFAPNAEGSQVCRIRFRDAKERIVHAHELLSGRLIALVCKAACEAAYLRDARGGSPGVCITDMDRAIGDALERLAGTLAPRNIGDYIPDLPQDVDIVAVEPLIRKKEYRFVNREA